MIWLCLQFQSKFAVSLASDVLFETISGICSGFLLAANTAVKRDRQLVAWLQEEVVGQDQPSPKYQTFTKQRLFHFTFHSSDKLCHRDQISLILSNIES